FADVADVIRAVVGLAMHPGAVGEVFNIGNTEEVTIATLAERVLAHTGSDSEVQYIPYEEAYAPGFEDMRRRVPSIEKVSQLIDYQPQNSLDDILRRVV